MKVLVANSDPLILKMFNLAFAKVDAVTIVGLTADDTEIVNICIGRVPDILLLDCRFCSREMVAEIKKHCPQMKVIILTLFGNPHEVKQALATGADGSIAKADGVFSLIESLSIMARAS